MKKTQVIISIEISTIYVEAKSFGFRAIKGSFCYLESILRPIFLLISPHYPYQVMVANR